jgi:hypothetical protein
MSISRYAALAALVALSACGADGGGVTEPDPDPVGDVCTGAYCHPDLIAGRGYDAFYKKILMAGDIPIISSHRVSDGALEAAALVVDSMLAASATVREQLVQGGAYVGVMDDTEVTTDIPEHAFLANDPNTDWDTRARGLGGTPARPITTVGEENLLCLTGDVYAGESILVHEFAHTIHLVGIALLDAGFPRELQAIFDDAMAEGLWGDTYAATNSTEYWAEGVQSWFDTNQRPQAGIHNEVDTRAELADYDPRLHDLIARYFTASGWSPECGG